MPVYSYLSQSIFIFQATSKSFKSKKEKKSSIVLKLLYSSTYNTQYFPVWFVSHFVSYQDVCNNHQFRALHNVESAKWCNINKRLWEAKLQKEFWIKNLYQIISVLGKISSNVKKIKNLFMHLG